MRDIKAGLALVFYVFPYLLFLMLFIESICILLSTPQQAVYFPSPLRPKLFTDAGRILRGDPELIHVLLIIFFGSYSAQGLLTYIKRIRNRISAGVALGFTLVSLFVLFYAFRELLRLYSLIFFGPFVLLGMLIAGWYLSPWDKWLKEKIRNRLREANGLISNYAEIVNDIKKSIGDLKLKTFDVINGYNEKMAGIEARIETPDADLESEESESRSLLKYVRLLKDIKTGKDIINEDEETLKNKILELSDEFMDKFNISEDKIDRMVQLRINQREDLKDIWNTLREELLKERSEIKR